MGTAQRYVERVRGANWRYHGYRVLSRLGLLKRVLHLDVGGTPMAVPILADGTGLALFTVHEPWFDALVAALLRCRRGAFVDVGANIGQTLLKVRGIDPGVPYYGFEPSPACFEYVQRLVRANRFTGCHLFPIGLSDEDGIVTLLSNTDVDTGASIVEGFRDPGLYSMATNVPVFVGDGVLESQGVAPIAVVKIDVEGAELEVLRGLRRTLESARPFVMCELLPVYDEETEQGRYRKARQDDVEALLARAGYVVYRALPDGRLARLEDFGVHSDLRLTNYVFVPKESVAAFIAETGGDAAAG